MKKLETEETRILISLLSFLVYLDYQFIQYSVYSGVFWVESGKGKLEMRL